MSADVVRVRAPATSANLGPGFDCAACALAIWNELEVEPADATAVSISGEGAGELPEGPENLALQAFALLAPVEGRRFRFANRIPLARGLGSSAAAVALGLVAGARAAGREGDAENLLALGVALEGHADNLAAALAGGVCLAWEEEGRTRIARIADAPPLEPVARRSSAPPRRPATPSSSRRRSRTGSTSRTARPTRRSSPRCGPSFRPAPAARRFPAPGRP